MDPQDAHIVQAIQSGDEAAFERLFRSWYPNLVGFARRFVQDPDESEELVQDFFFQLWEKRQQFSLSTSLRSYLFTAVRNRCFNYLQHHKVRRQHQEGIADRLTSLGQSSGPQEQLEHGELAQRIDAAVEALPPRCREVFVASRYEGKKYKEIAESLGISPRTVEVQIGKALKQLRSALKDILPLIIWWLTLGGGEL